MDFFLTRPLLRRLGLFAFSEDFPTVIAVACDVLKACFD